MAERHVEQCGRAGRVEVGRDLVVLGDRGRVGDAVPVEQVPDEGQVPGVDLGAQARDEVVRIAGREFSGTSRSTSYGLPPVRSSIQVSWASSSSGV